MKLKYVKPTEVVPDQSRLYNIFLLLKKRKNSLQSLLKNEFKQVFLDSLRARFLRHKDNEAEPVPSRSLRGTCTQLMINKVDLRSAQGTGGIQGMEKVFRWQRGQGKVRICKGKNPWKE